MVRGERLLRRLCREEEAHHPLVLSEREVDLSCQEDGRAMASEHCTKAMDRDVVVIQT
jgi:hypothetical protein